MSAMTALARAEAVDRGRAQPIATVRHVHLAARPLVFVPLTLAGEANAPLAAVAGDAVDAPGLLVVPQPRNRDQRFAFAASLAGLMVPYINGRSRSVETVAGSRNSEPRPRYTDAPQILVPNRGGVGFVRLFGRSTRFRRTYGEHAVDTSVPMLGRWLTFLAERAEHPGSSVLLAMTDVLALHWASGQSWVEDANLAALMGWIDPPAGLNGSEAAAAAEDFLLCPPAGPATDPSFDNEVLAKAIDAYDRAADDEAARRRALTSLEAALRDQLLPTWELMWRAVDLLRALPEGQRVAGRWALDRAEFTSHVEHLDNGGPPQPRRDGAVASAVRLNRLERAQDSYDAQRAFDDPLVMADHRLTGEAFVGTVVAATPNRIDASGPRRVLRPHITVATADPVRLEPGAVVTAPTRAKQEALIVSTSSAGTAVEVVLELRGGMGRALVPAPGSVPEVGEQLCYTTLVDGFQPPTSFPARDATPWTHGGPPPAYVPDDEDAAEEWA